MIAHAEIVIILIFMGLYSISNIDIIDADDPSLPTRFIVGDVVIYRYPGGYVCGVVSNIVSGFWSDDYEITTDDGRRYTLMCADNIQHIRNYA